MSGTYYNLPAISCKDRINTWSNLKGGTMCANLNPDKIYNNLYPCASTQLNGFDKQINTIGFGTKIKTLNGQTALSCAKKCIATENCSKFNINSIPPTCSLYNTKSYTNNSDRAKIESLYNNISAFQYNRNVNNNCKRSCIQNNINNFTETQQYQVPKAWDDKGTALKAFQTAKLKDCKEACITNKGCNSIVFEDPMRNCTLLQTNPDSAMPSNKKGNDYYKKNDKKCQNIFGFSQSAFDNPNYKNAYKGYQPSGDDYGGKVGDYFCKYMKGAKACVEYKDVTCSNNRKRRPKPPIPNPHSGPSACLPPLCNPNSGKLIHKTIKGIQINDHQFDSCQKGKDKGFCLEDIYTFDDLGLPVTQSASNPPGKNFLYTKDFTIQNGFRIYSCIKGLSPYEKGDPPIPINKGSSYTGDYICSDSKGHSCIPYGQKNTDGQYHTCPKQTNMLYPTDKMKTIENCMSWCYNNPLCNSLNTTYDSSGKLVCNFYTKGPQTGITTKSMGSNIYSKNQDPYVYTPDEKLLKRFKGPIGPKGYTLKYYKDSLQCGPYGCCADGTKAADKGGTNCLTPIDRVGSASTMFPYTALGGTNHRVSIDDQSGSSYMNYNEAPEQFMNYTSNDANNYIIKFIILLFVILVGVLMYSKYKK
jgi:hypothetical protein